MYNDMHIYPVNIEVENFAEANRVLLAMQDICKNYGYVTVADLYDMCGQSCDYTCVSYGWNNLEDAKVSKLDNPVYRAGKKYMAQIVMPRAHLVEEPGIDSTHKTGEIEPDMVNHPPHYQSESGLEVIDVIETFTADLMGIEATDTGNVIKYICRWKHKNGLQDLEKAKWYLEHLINHIKKENE